MSQNLFDQLIHNLEEIVKVYRGLLNVVRVERDILVSSQLDDLNANNQVKEKTLLEARSLEKKRQIIVNDFLVAEGLQIEEPTLSEIAKNLDPERGEKLRSLHSVLELLVKRVKSINAENESLVKAALQHITGAMNSIKDMLDDNKTYQKKGKVEGGGKSSGHLVSKQV